MSKKNKKWRLPLVLGVPILLLLFTTCFSSLSDNSNETTLSITLPGGSPESGRSVWLTSQLKFEVSGTGPGGQSFIESASGGTVIVVRIVPGLWLLSAKAFDASTPSIIEADSKIISINAIAGQNNKSEIQMRFCRTNLIYDYLSDMSSAGPISLHMAMELSDSNWDDLLIAIDNAGKDVDLNLSACTRGPSGTAYGLMSSGIFDPNPSDPTGKDKIVSLILPEATEEIIGTTGSIATFEYFDYLTEITLGGNITTIGEQAFMNSNLERVTIGNSVTIIGDYAFRDCTSLSSVSFGNSITSIGDSAFILNNQLTKIALPNSVTSIGDNAFAFCDLSELIIGNDVQTIGVAAFSDNEITGEIIIPDSVNIIGDSAFFNNEITKVTIPDNISIGWTAFYNNNSLNTVIFKGDNVTLYPNTFDGNLEGEFNAPGGGAGTYIYDGSTWVKQ